MDIKLYTIPKQEDVVYRLGTGIKSDKTFQDISTKNP